MKAAKERKHQLSGKREDGNDLAQPPLTYFTVRGCITGIFSIIVNKDDLDVIPEALKVHNVLTMTKMQSDTGLLEGKGITHSISKAI